uniref:Protein kinase domain-containing protein n=1 Tax=Panagrellus redivivus TaxID=6233 RepID=A0A7E4VPA8_PANRE
MHYFLATIIAGICLLGTLARATCVVDDNHSARCFSLTEVAKLLPLAETVTKLEVSCSDANETIPIGVFEQFSNLITFEMHGCYDAFADLLEVLPHLQNLNVRGNGIRLAPWQRFQYVVLTGLDLRANPLSCDCANSWIWAYLHKDTKSRDWDHYALKLPRDIWTDPGFKDCDFRKCPTESVESTSSIPMANLTIGSALNLQCRMNSTVLPSPNYNESTHPAFIWPHYSNQHQAHPNRIETWNPLTHDMTLQVQSLSSAELGYAVCICQWCSRPVFDTYKLYFPTNVTVALDLEPRHPILTVHGYPLQALRMFVTRLVDNETEEFDLSDKSRTEWRLFNNTTTVQYEEFQGHSDFLRYYTLKVPENVMDGRQNSHIDSDYEFRVCRGNESTCAVAVGELVNAHRTHKHLDPIDPPPNEESALWGIVVLILGIAIVILVILFSRTHIKHKLLKKGWEIRRRRISRNTDRTEETSIRLEDYSASNSMNYIVQHVPIIERDTLEIKERIGKGAFGEVYVAEWYPKDDVTSPTKVAVKMLFNVTLDSELDKEAALLAMLDHPNIVKLFGIARGEGQISLVMEMMNLGDLKTFVRDRAPRCDNYSQFPPALIPSELLNIAGQVAAGLAYLASQNIVHRDLAGRNCLVQGESDLKFCNAAFRKSITVKISDFGMSRRLFSDTEYYKMHNSKTVLPVRWLPPECLSLGKFTHQSDMWSFGMVLYEIFSYGAMPYGDLSNSEVVSAVMSGARPKLPSTFPEPINALIEACWRTDPELRITATEALNRLGIIA